MSSSEFFTVVTNQGLVEIAKAINEDRKVGFKFMSFGDGNGATPLPDPSKEALVNEVQRVEVNSVEIHPENANWVIVEAILPAHIGGFLIRECGLHDESGKLIAYGNYPTTHKPISSSGAARILTIHLILQISNTDAVELIVDPNIILATRKYVDDALAKVDTVTLKHFGAVLDGVTNDALPLYQALSSNNLIEVRAPLFAQIQDPNHAKVILENLHKLIIYVPSVIKLPPHLIEFNADYITKLTSSHSLLQIHGFDPAPLKITNVISASGGYGEWDVVYEMEDVSNIQPNNYIKIDNVIGGKTWFERATDRLKPYPGELAVGVNKLGIVTSSGITVTFPSAKENISKYLEIGMLLTVKGQTRIISTIDDNAKTLTVNTAFESNATSEEDNAGFDKDLTNYQWWYYTYQSNGSISIAADSMCTGIGTNFTAYNIGDLILFDGCVAEILTINSDTSMQLSSSIVVNNVKFTRLKCPMIKHEGTWLVTAKNGNQITVKQHCWHGYKAAVLTNGVITQPEFPGIAPPIQGWIGAEAKLLKTVLKQNKLTGNGLESTQGASITKIDNLVISSIANNTGTAIDLKGLGSAYDAIQSQVVLGSNTAVSRFNYAVDCFAGSVLHAPGAHFSGQRGSAVQSIDGGQTYLRGSVISGPGGIGAMVSGGYSRMSTARIIGAKLQAIRTDVGGFVYSDSGFIFGCGSHGIMNVNLSGMQWCDGYSICNQYDGINLQNGASGRYTRTFLACNGNRSMSITSSNGEAGQIWSTGCKGTNTGVIVNNSRFALTNAAITGNGGIGIYALSAANVSAKNVYISKNKNNGIRAVQKSVVDIIGGFCANNAAAIQINSTNASVLVTGNESIIEGTQIISSQYTNNIIMGPGSVYKIDYQNTAATYTFGCIHIYGTTLPTARGMVYFRKGIQPVTNKEWGNDALIVATGIKTEADVVADKLMVSAADDGCLYLVWGGTGAIQFSYNLLGRL